MKKDSINFIEPMFYVENLAYSIALFNNSFILFKEENQSTYDFTNITHSNSNDSDLNNLNHLNSLFNLVETEKLSKDRFLYIFCNEEANFEIILSFMRFYSWDNYYFFLLKGTLFKIFIKDKIPASEKLSVFSTIPPEIVEEPYISNPDIKIERLNMKNFDYVCNHYESDASYIKSRIEDLMLGIFYKDEIAGFIGIHEDGSMGLLFVDENFRQKGFGTLLEKTLISHMRKNGRSCFGQIETTNELSLIVHKKAGYKISEEISYWFY